MKGKFVEGVIKFSGFTILSTVALITGQRLISIQRQEHEWLIVLGSLAVFILIASICVFALLKLAEWAGNVMWDEA